MNKETTNDSQKTKFVVFAILLFWTHVFASTARSAERPNIVLIIADDQAWTDYGFMGHEVIQTPSLDQLASQSLVFERGYVAAPICRPSLASIVTGSFPFDHGVTGNDANGGKQRAQLDLPIRKSFHEKNSLIKNLSSNGYATFQSGKWWEGSWKDGGFTDGMTHGDPKRGGRHGDQGLAIGRKSLKPITEFIEHATEANQSFFVWYAPFLPHTPHNPPSRLLKKYSRSGRDPSVAKYFAMCEWFDETCGQLLGYLKDENLADNTIVIYICDNGWAAAATNQDDPNQKLWSRYAQRSKSSPFENGIRTPIMISWPGTIDPMRTRELAHAIDLFPTIAAATGMDSPETLTGINLLDEQQRSQRTAVFGVCHATHNMSFGKPDDTLQYLWCVEGDWKLMVRYSGNDTTQYKNLHVWDKLPTRLYNLANDPKESRELSSQYPEIVRRMSNRIKAWHPVKQTK